jgi:hypothetical protein
MQRALEQDASPAIEGHDDSFRLVVSDLVSLIGHVQASVELIETAIARESSQDGQDDGGVVVLDDVTPCYAAANAALLACNVSLSTALQSLLDASKKFSKRFPAGE